MPAQFTQAQQTAPIPGPHAEITGCALPCGNGLERSDLSPLAALASGYGDQPASPTDEDLTPDERLGEEEALRALERNLMREGALVLSPGAFELEPGLNFSYRGSNDIRIVSQDGQAVVATADQKQTRFDFSLTFTVGLPGNSQLTLRAPYVRARRQNVIAGVESAETQSGLGDIEVGLTKHFLRERGAWSGLLASIFWSDPGDHEAEPALTGPVALSGISVGSGLRTLLGSLTAVKRKDPLVFFGSLFYATSRSENEGVIGDPGDWTGSKLGAILAVSPDTSVRAAAQLVFVDETRLNGHEIPGSDQVIAQLELGVATVLSARTLLDVTGVIGLTDEAPNFQLRVAVPVRF